MYRMINAVMWRDLTLQQQLVLLKGFQPRHNEDLDIRAFLLHYFSGEHNEKNKSHKILPKHKIQIL